MKRTYWIVAGVAGLLLLGLAMAPGFIDWSQYKAPAIEQIRKATGYDVALDGELKMSLLPGPHLYARDVRVTAPAGSTVPNLATAKRLEVSLALLPLLTGRVEVSSVTLVEPVIALEVFQDGLQNWMTPEIKAMQEAGPDTSEASSAPAVAVEELRLEKGAFTYRPAGQKPLQLDDINVRLSADSLKGPFTAEGSLRHAGQDIHFEGRTARMENDGASVPLNVQMSIGERLLDLSFAGVASVGDKPEIQGETTLIVSNIKELHAALTGAPSAAPAMRFQAKGLLTADAKEGELRNAAVGLDDARFNGSLDWALDPLRIKADLSGEDTFNLDPILASLGAASGGGGSKTEGQATSAALLPREMTLPAGLEADVRLRAPAMILHGEIFDAVDVRFAKGESKIDGAFAAQKIPGGGQMEAQMDLRFTPAPQNDGTVLLSDPQARIVLDLSSNNPAQLARALTGSAFALPGGVRTLAYKGQMTLKPDDLTLAQSDLRLNDTSVSIAGSYAVPAGKRPLVKADIAAAAMDADNLLGLKAPEAGKAKEGAPADGGLSDVASALRGFSLPFDLDFDAGVQKLRVQGQDIEGLRAQGRYRDNQLHFDNLSAQNYAGGAFKLSGDINALKTLTDVDVSLQAQSQDIAALAQHLGLDPADLPANVKQASVTAKLAGSMAQANVSADISAMGGTLSASGVMKDVLGQRGLSNMGIELRHQNMAEALRLFAPGVPRYGSWAKPMTLSASVEQSGDTTTLRGIKGTLAGASISGDISYTAAARPVVKGTLTLGEMIMTGGAASQAAAVTRPGGSRWSDAPMDNGWMTAMNADIDLKAQRLLYEGWDLRNMNTRFVLQDGRLELRDMGSDLFGGRFSLAGTASAPAGGKGPLNLDMNTSMSGVSVEQVVTAFTGGRILQGQGTLDKFEASVKGSGASARALVGSLAGSGSMSGRGIVLEGFDLERFARALSSETKPGDTALGLWKTASKGGSTQFDTLSGTFTIAQGVATITKLDLDGPKAAITTQGKVDLPAWRIETAHTISLKEAEQGVPPFTVHISGPLDNPANTFGQGLLQDYMQRKISRKIESLIQDKIGGGLGQKLGIPGLGGAPAPQQVEPSGAQEPATGAPAQGQPQQQPEGPVTPEDALRGVLQGILR